MIKSKDLGYCLYFSVFLSVTPLFLLTYACSIGVWFYVYTLHDCTHKCIPFYMLSESEIVILTGLKSFIKACMLIVNTCVILNQNVIPIQNCPWVSGRWPSACWRRPHIDPFRESFGLTTGSGVRRMKTTRRKSPSGWVPVGRSWIHNTDLASLSLWIVSL